MEKYKICAVTGTRADYGLLKRTLLRFENNTKIELEVVITGSHLSENFGNTQNEVIEDGYKNIIKIDILEKDDSKRAMVESTGIAVEKFAGYFYEKRPDMLVVLGDRFEIFAAATAAAFLGIEIAHISGGDITEGAIDDTIRHCITKMSYLHFPGCEQSAKRIIQMGENPNRVFNVGEPGVENCLNMEVMTLKQLSESIDFDITDTDYAVVTFHPATIENDTAYEQTYELIHAMNKFADMKYIITMANADAGGRMINDIWIKESEKHPNWFLTPSLGVLRYLSAVKYAKIVIGNSSSGIVEAPVLKTPTINIGSRQKGRMMAESIVNCSANYDDIVNVMSDVLEQSFYQKCQKVISPFGDGTTSCQIEKIILERLSEKEDKNISCKHFYDIDF